MKLHLEQLQTLLEIASRAAIKAGIFIQSQVNTDIQILKKEGGESLASQVVTEIDLQAQEIILSFINPTLIEYDLALLTEESEDDRSRFNKDYFWAIDPLDGTLPFTEGIDGYAVSIALVNKQGESVLGVVYNPVSTHIYTAIKGQGTFKNGRLVQTETHSKFTFAHDRSLSSQENYTEICSEINEIAKANLFDEIQIISHCGSVMNAIHILENAPAIYMKQPKRGKGGGSIWDFAATSCICIEAGVIVTDYFGNPLDLNRIDSTFMNHKGVRFSNF